jgi:predicted RNase H-like nuclease (RuvC/YqgF family)
MYPYGEYQVPQVQYDYNPYVQQDQFDPNRQPQQLERRVNQLERENNRQAREIDQLQRRLQRVNQRLRVLERRFQIPFTPFDGEF